VAKISTARMSMIKFLGKSGRAFYGVLPVIAPVLRYLARSQSERLKSGKAAQGSFGRCPRGGNAGHPLQRAAMFVYCVSTEIIPAAG
jgi:hypothetical protein